jgi:hypothetical protein
LTIKDGNRLAVPGELVPGGSLSRLPADVPAI